MGGAAVAGGGAAKGRPERGVSGASRRRLTARERRRPGRGRSGRAARSRVAKAALGGKPAGGGRRRERGVSERVGGDDPVAF